MTEQQQPMTARVARAMPIPIHLAKVRLVSDASDTEPAKYEQTEDVETFGVRFTAGALCDIEERWGTTALWQKALNDQPYSTIRATTAMLTRRPEAEIEEALLREEWWDYLAAFGQAFAIANGVDPTSASQLPDVMYYRKRSADLRIPPESHDELASSNEKPSVDTPGSPGSTRGPEPAVSSTPSGDTPQPS